MRTTLFLALSLTTLPAWAAGPTPEPPTPPPVTWEVWGYKWDGQWVVQPDHCLKTTDLKQAADYEAQLVRFPNWTARSNIPALCNKVSTLPDAPTGNVYTVWSFHLENGKWVKDEKYCWTTPDAYNSRDQALAYAKTINAVAGWRATTNAPESTRQTVGPAATYQSNAGHGASNRSYYAPRGNYSRDLFGRPANYRDQFNAGSTNIWVQPPNPD
jgi:hypothetical protein